MTYIYVPFTILLKVSIAKWQDIDSQPKVYESQQNTFIQDVWDIKPTECLTLTCQCNLSVSARTLQIVRVPAGVVPAKFEKEEIH